MHLFPHAGEDTVEAAQHDLESALKRMNSVRIELGAAEENLSAARKHLDEMKRREAEKGQQPARHHMTDIPRGKYIGKRQGDTPKDESEHFIKCAECGGWIDCRDLGHVLSHEGPLPHPAEDQEH